MKKIKICKYMVLMAMAILILQGNWQNYKTKPKQVEAATVKNMVVDNKKVKKGNVSISKKTYKNITIKNSVGNATISLNSVTVSGTITIENNASCKIKISNSKIAGIKVKEVTLTKNKKLVPTIKIEKKTTVNKITLIGNVNLSSTGNVKEVILSPKKKSTVVTNLTGLLSMVKLNSSANSDTTITVKNCKINSLIVSKGTKQNKFTVKNAKKDNKSLIEELKILAPISMKLNTKTNNIYMGKEAIASNLLLGNHIAAKSLSIEGKGIMVSGTGKVKDVNISSDNVKIDLEIGNLTIKEGTTGVIVNGDKVENNKDNKKDNESEQTEENSSNNTNQDNSNQSNSNQDNSNQNNSNQNNSNQNNSNQNNSNQNGENTTQKDCTVTFDAHLGYIAGSNNKKITVNVKKGNKIDVIPKAEYEFKDFLGWSETENGQIIDFSTYVVTKDITLKAVFLDKLQMNLRASLEEEIEYDAQSGKMVIKTTGEEAISPKEAISVASGAAFVIDNVGDKKASLVVYSLNDSKVSIVLTKGIELTGEVIEGIPIPGYTNSGKYYKNLPEGSYRITCVLDNDNSKILSRPFYVMKNQYKGK